MRVLLTQTTEWDAYSWWCACVLLVVAWWRTLHCSIHSLIETHFSTTWRHSFTQCQTVGRAAFVTSCRPSVTCCIIRCSLLTVMPSNVFICVCLFVRLSVCLFVCPSVLLSVSLCTSVAGSIYWTVMEDLNKISGRCGGLSARNSDQIFYATNTQHFLVTLVWFNDTH